MPFTLKKQDTSPDVATPIAILCEIRHGRSIRKEEGHIEAGILVRKFTLIPPCHHMLEDEVSRG